MTGCIGVRFGLGVVANSSGVTGLGPAHGHTSAPLSGQEKNRQQKSPHVTPQGSPCNASHHFFSAAVPTARPAIKCRSSSGSDAWAPLGPVVVRLSNIPSEVDQSKVHDMLAPWHPRMGNLTMATSPGANTHTFFAEMDYGAAMEAISELHQSTLAGNTVLVTSEGIEAPGELGTSPEPQDLLL